MPVIILWNSEKLKISDKKTIDRYLAKPLYLALCLCFLAIE